MKREHFAPCDEWWDNRVEIMDEKPDITDAPDAIDCQDVRGEIDFDHVSFSYHKQQDNLTDVSFSLLPGQTLGILGTTGSGRRLGK